MPKFVKGRSGNPAGRPKVGLSFADKVRAVVGADGHRLAEMWAAITFNRMPPKPKISSAVVAWTCLKSLVDEADLRDRITCSRLLAERGFGTAKQEMEHSGYIALPTKVVHEYHHSS